MLSIKAMCVCVCVCVCVVGLHFEHSPRDFIVICSCITRKWNVYMQLWNMSSSNLMFPCEWMPTGKLRFRQIFGCVWCVAHSLCLLRAILFCTHNSTCNSLWYFTMLKYSLKKSLPSQSRTDTTPRLYCVWKYSHDYKSYGYILQNNLFLLIIGLSLSISYMIVCLWIRTFWDTLFLFIYIIALCFMVHVCLDTKRT